MLTGRYRPGQDVQEGTRFSLGGIGVRAGTLYQQRYWNDSVFSAVEGYRNWCTEHGRNMVTTAIQWVISQRGITSAIIGASRANQLKDVLDAVSAPSLTQDDVGDLDQLWFQLPKRREFR